MSLHKNTEERGWTVRILDMGPLMDLSHWPIDFSQYCWPQKDPDSRNGCSTRFQNRHKIKSDGKQHSSPRKSERRGRRRAEDSAVPRFHRQLSLSLRFLVFFTPPGKFVFLFLHWFLVFFIDYKVDSIMGFVYFVTGYWNLYELRVLMHPKSQSSLMFAVFVLLYSNLL